MLAATARFLEPLFYPVGFFWMLHTVLAIVLFRKRKWAAGVACATLVVLIWVIGSTSVPFRLLASLEKPYVRNPAAPVPEADAILMLGGTLIPSSNDLFGFEIADAGDRAITALELLRQRRAPVLVLGGGGRTEAGESREAALLANWFRAWGETNAVILSLKPSFNTHDEAVQMKARVEEKKWNRILLVTSAFHMKRSQALFSALDVPVIPFACDFSGLGGLENPDRQRSLFPEIEGFRKLNLYLHERIGWWFYRARGWIGNGNPPPTP